MQWNQQYVGRKKILGIQFPLLFTFVYQMWRRKSQFFLCWNNTQRVIFLLVLCLQLRCLNTLKCWQNLLGWSHDNILRNINHNLLIRLFTMSKSYEFYKSYEYAVDCPGMLHIFWWVYQFSSNEIVSFATLILCAIII